MRGPCRGRACRALAPIGFGPMTVHTDAEKLRAARPFEASRGNVLSFKTIRKRFANPTTPATAGQ